MTSLVKSELSSGPRVNLNKYILLVPEARCMSAPCTRPLAFDVVYALPSRVRKIEDPEVVEDFVVVQVEPAL